MHTISRRHLLRLGAVSGLAGYQAWAIAMDHGPNPLVGEWTYRSFLSDPDPNTAFNDLQFAVASLKFAEAPFGQVVGTLSFDDDYLALKGAITYGNPFALRFQGTGATPGTIEQGVPWVYDYQGYLAPAWPNGVDQRPAIIGTIVRTVPHSQGRAKAGVVASWIAVRKDSATPAPADPDKLLRKLEIEWAAAAVTNNAGEIGRYLSKDFLFVGPKGVLQDRQQHLDDFRTGKLKLTTVNVKDSTVVLFSSGAIVNSLTTVVGQIGDREINGDFRFMDTWTMQTKQWLAVARQQTSL